MCRNIKTLYNFAPPATQDEIRASALQFVRNGVGALEDAARELRKFNEEDLKPRHQMIFKAPEKPLPLIPGKQA